MRVAAVFAVTALCTLFGAYPSCAETAACLRWEPQTDEDRRLQQPVKVDILGRAATPALALLSEKTGVSLQVAPENLDSLGERKLTIIAQGCSLKSLMVQIPKALPECHWDVVKTGAQPVYLLHRFVDWEEKLVKATAEAAASKPKAREQWTEPNRPKLKRIVTLPFRGKADPLGVQLFIARESGLSLVSDYFDTWGPQQIPHEATTPQPLWRLLYLLGESWYPHGARDQQEGFAWSHTGDCLVLHDVGWQDAVLQEARTAGESPVSGN